MAERRPAVAGMFYTADPGRLRREVESYLSAAGPVSDEGVTGIVSPHAGYVYSGRIAGAAFASAPADIQTVLVVAPCHRFPVAGASVYGGEAYRTPLGAARVNRTIVARLAELGFGYEPRAHSMEHAEEVQIPFVQVRWPFAMIVPILQGSVSASFSRSLASSLVTACEGQGRMLFVASSDLSHYHPIEAAKQLDGRFGEAFATGDPSAIEGLLTRGRAEACGAGPVMTLLAWAAESGPFEAGITAYDTSAAASGDESAVVGYMAGCTRRLAS